MAENAKYRQVVDWIQEKLRSGELKPGDRLESENELGARFGISRQTVRHALDALEWQGVLLRRRGSGTYIRAREAGRVAESWDDREPGRMTGSADGRNGSGMHRTMSGVESQNGRAAGPDGWNGNGTRRTVNGADGQIDRGPGRMADSADGRNDSGTRRTVNGANWRNGQAASSAGQYDTADIGLTGDSGGVLSGERFSARPQRELSHTVTVISTFVDGYIFPGILQAMVATLERLGYGARIMFTNNRLETERRLLAKLLEEDSRDPLIIEPVMSGLPNPNLAYYRRLQERGIPILFFNSYYPELAIPHVSMDDTEAGQAAADYLIGQGHTAIGCIFKNDDGQGRRRYKGYLKALIAAGIEVCESRVCWIDTHELEHFGEAFPRICKRLEGCTACVCYNDEVAHMVSVEYAKCGVQIPDGISLVSFDNSELARLNAVRLTSVSHPIEVLGARAAENMIRLIRDPGFDATYEFETQLEIRDSVACRKRAEEL